MFPAMSFDLEYYETFDCFEKKDNNGRQPMNLTMSKTINNMCIKLVFLLNSAEHEIYPANKTFSRRTND